MKNLTFTIALSVLVLGLASCENSQQSQATNFSNVGWRRCTS